MESMALYNAMSIIERELGTEYIINNDFEVGFVCPNCQEVVLEEDYPDVGCCDGHPICPICEEELM